MSRGGGYNSSYKGKRGGYQGNWNNGHGNNNNNNNNSNLLIYTFLNPNCC